ncbi:hypothetical protein GCM10009539_24020 [Cryptosporangium japonicum]|uniref:HTH merR-type domain-containing protein n=1 Tax=Cryptosporangium japonicum TaxID=80872 RepID=A0ABN0U429_9ACTN
MALYSIGELSRRTGLTVKAIRFYADRGIVPATRRNATGHRLYDEDAAARLDLVRSLRDLGIDLPTIRRVLAREVTVADAGSSSSSWTRRSTGSTVSPGSAGRSPRRCRTTRPPSRSTPGSSW